MWRIYEDCPKLQQMKWNSVARPPPSARHRKHSYRSRCPSRMLCGGLPSIIVGQRHVSAGQSRLNDAYPLAKDVCVLGVPAVGTKRMSKNSSLEVEELLQTHVASGSSSPCCALKFPCGLIVTAWGRRPRDNQVNHSADAPSAVLLVNL